MTQMCFYLSNPRHRAGGAPLRCLLAGVVALATTGCWEEIPYRPPAVAPATPAAKATPSEPVVESAATPQADAQPVTEPSADELFGGESSPPPDVINLPPPAYVPPPEAEESAAPSVVPPTPQQRLDAWTLASSWSLAAAVSAKGLGPDRYEPMLAEARRAAAALGVDLPPLPTADADSAAEREAAVVAALRTSAGAELVGSISHRLNDAAGAAAQLAMDSHLLLLSYSPSSPDAANAASALRAAGESAALPPELWQPLVELLDERADFKAVRGAVFALHKSIGEYLTPSTVGPGAITADQ